MDADEQAKHGRLYLGIDIGGTKIQTSLVGESGLILKRKRCPTPRDGGPDEVLLVLDEAIRAVVEKAGLTIDEVTALGIAVPGVVDPDAGRVVVTPNMSLSGVDIGSHLESRYDVPVALGNDCNLGALGEAWLGSARKAASSMSILVGTGIGSGVVHEGGLWRGAREAAGEIGHIVMEIGGPRCGCGNLGCLEALASRSAIERDLRAAVEAGRKTVLTEILEEDLTVIRSGALGKALEQGDELVSEVLHRASEVLGHACLTVRHLIDPAVIVFGGGVLEACSDFMMPVIEGIVGSDQLPGAREGGGVLLSALGDDAVVLGAVALALRRAGRNPFEERYAVKPEYPPISGCRFGEVAIGRNTYAHDVIIPVSGKVKKRKKQIAKESYGSSHTLGPVELTRVCRGGPEVLFVGTGQSGQMELNEEGRRYLSQRLIECCALPTPEAVEAYNASNERKAALIHVTC